MAHAWSYVDSATQMAPGAPITAIWDSNESRLDLFAVDYFGVVQHALKDWTQHQWSPVHSEIHLTRGSTISAQWRYGSIIILGIAEDGLVWQITWTGKDQDQWKAWTYLAGAMMPGSDLYRPAGKMFTQVWGSTSNGVIRGATEIHEKIGSWSYWEDVRGEDKVAPGSNLTFIASEEDPINGHMDLYIIGTDGQVWTTWFSDDYFE